MQNISPHYMLALAHMTDLGVSCVASRTYNIGASGLSSEVLHPDDKQFYNLLYDIQFGEDANPDILELTLTHRDIEARKVLLDSATLREGWPVFAEWSPSQPLRIQVVNRNATAEKVSISLRFIQFKQWMQFIEYMNLLAKSVVPPGEEGRLTARYVR